MKSLADILFSRYSSKQLASFYILRDNVLSTDCCAEQEYHSFIQQVLCHEKVSNSSEAAQKCIQLGHPDLLRLAPPEKAHEYAQADFSDFFKFQNFTSIELTHRFVLVTEAQLINDRLGNKLLKTLEEPQKDTSIFFIVPQGHRVLPTINSRAISLSFKTSINKPEINSPTSFSEWLSTKEQLKDLSNSLESYLIHDGSLLELLTLLKGKAALQDDLCQALIEWNVLTPQSFESNEKILTIIKNYGESRAFRNPPNERLSQLLYHMKTTLQNS